MSVKLKQGVLSLGEFCPRLIAEWHPDLNQGITPFDVAGKSVAPAWWLCIKGHTWRAPIANRSKRGDGCPVCSGRIAESGVNDLETVNPELAKEWHPTLNNDLLPSQVKSKSGLKVWWQCPKGHEYICAVSSRASGVRCGECFRSGNRPKLNREEIHISQVAELLASFDFESNADADVTKILVWSTKKLHWRCDSGHAWVASPTSRMRGTRASGCPVCKGRIAVPGVNDVATLYPNLAAEFDVSRNAPLKFSELPSGSKDKFWWLCDKGHSYLTSLRSRKYQGSSCPVCANFKVVSGVNDMKTTHPMLAAEFDLARNYPSTPETLVAGVRKKLWWLCPLGHSYEAAGYSRVTGTGCAFCINKRVLTGFNDMATTHPELAAEFDHSRNQGVAPTEINAGTFKKLWWLCDQGHSYVSPGVKRVGEGAGCPYCSNKRVIEGFNDMATRAPQLVPHFHPTRNAPDTPSSLSPRTNKTLWWLCDAGHEYQAKAGNRLQVGGLGCPVCSNHKVLAGFNDLATTRPDIASSWHPVNNGLTTPQMVLAGTNKKAWWICSEGHEWYAFISLRSGGRGCPRCAKPGYDSTKPGWLYFISSQELGARKIGISNFEFKRLAEYEVHWTAIKLWSHESGLAVAGVETQTLKWLRKEKGLPQFLGREEMGQAGGFTETFSFDGVSDFEVITYIESLFRKLEE